MSHLEQSEIDSASRIDLAEFLLSKGIRLNREGKQYLWEDKNVWIKNNTWYSHYEHEGGYPITFVMKYFNKTFQEAVAELNGNRFSLPEFTTKRAEKELPKLKLPPRNSSTYKMYMYLLNARGIDGEIIDFFIYNGTLYEDAEHHDCIFVGRNENERPCHIHRRSTSTPLKQTIAGSQIEYAFHYNGTDDTIYVFEAPIDMLAFISMNKRDWRKHSYVALCSVADRALLHQLEVHENLNHIVLCLDSDEAGQSAEERISETLFEKGYTKVEKLIPEGKDWDEDLKNLIREEFLCQESKSSFSQVL